MYKYGQIYKNYITANSISLVQTVKKNSLKIISPIFILSINAKVDFQAYSDIRFNIFIMDHSKKL